MRKKFSALIAILLCLSLLTPVFALEYGGDIDPSEKIYTQTFSDVPESHWAFRYIAEMVDRGAVSGYPDGLFRPNNNVTRAEFAKIMLGAAGLPAQQAPSSSFRDVPLTHWASPFIEAAKPYLTAYADGTFRPDTHALREDIAVAVVKLLGYDTRLADLAMLNAMFSDVAAISSSLQPYIALAVENGLISGYPDGTFRAQGQITRAEVAAILWRAFQYGSDEKIVPGDSPLPVQTPVPSQTPIPTYAPMPSASPEPVTATVDTLSSLPAGTSEYVFTENGDIYYLMNNQLFLQSGGITTQLYDGNSDFYEELTDAEVVDGLLLTPGPFQSNGTADKVRAEYDGWVRTPANLNYYDYLLLSNLTYDPGSGQVFLCGTTNAEMHLSGIGAGYSDSYYIATRRIFDVSDMNHALGIWMVPSSNSWHTQAYEFLPQYLYCMDGDLYLNIGTSLYSGENSCLRFQPATKIASVYDSNVFSAWGSYFTLGNDWIHYNAGSVEKLNLSTGSWETVTTAMDDRRTLQYDTSAVNVYQNQIYYATDYELGLLKPEGTNRLKGVSVLSWSELTVNDHIPMGRISALLFDRNGDIMFADEEHMLLRKITNIPLL